MHKSINRRRSCAVGPSARAGGRHVLAWLAAACLYPGLAHAQRTDADPTAAADDAFGTSIGDESVGLYSSGSVRGFSPVSAGNIRIEGLYIDRLGGFSDRLMESSAIRVGVAAQNYLFPAPTGIADYRLRSAGDEFMISSRIGYGPFGGGAVEFDAKVPMADEGVRLAFGAGSYLDEAANGSDSRTLSYALIPRWTPHDRVTIIPLFSSVITEGKQPSPVYIGSGARMPESVRRRDYIGPRWADGKSTNRNYGVIARTQLPSGWDLSAGLFRSSLESEDSVSYRLINVSADGHADRIVSADPVQETVSDSGEVLVGRKWRSGDRVHHSLYGSVKGKRRSNLHGGGSSIALGRRPIEAHDDSRPPEFSFGPRGRESVRQLGAGISYEARMQEWATLNVGIQKVEYEKRTQASGKTSKDAPLLYNVAATWTPRKWLTAYASHTKGLEDAGSAPDYAVNRAQVMPAIRTAQSDAGLLWRLGPNLRLVTGYFDVAKPYLDLDANGIYTTTGDVTHKGFEISLSGEVREGTSVLLGAVLMDPVVTGHQYGIDGKELRPVGQSRTSVTLSATHQLSRLPNLSISTSLNFYGSKYADKQNAVEIGGYTQIDLGARYRFRIGEAKAMLRLQVTNLTDKFSWRVLGSNVYEFNSPRSYGISLIVDS